jgi:type II restriction/modification system DNA methylase subunit YeeA
VWRDEAWKADGAAVRVTILCFSKKPQEYIILDGQPALHINSNLIASNLESFDLTQASQLIENKGKSFQGTTRSGPFDIEGDLARQWLKLGNPHLKPNLDVLKPWISGTQITDRAEDKWIIDFGIEMSEDDACLYEKPFDYVKRHVLPKRLDNRNPRLVQKFWHYDGVRVGMRQAINPLSRYIATVVTAKHRVFVWLNKHIQPDATLIAIARDDDVSFGILHSRFHELWSLRLGTTLEDRPRYTPTTTFETFPFPKGLELNVSPKDCSNPHAEKIAAAARRLNELRDNWLNPPDLIRREPEVVEGFPERVIPLNDAAAKLLKERTLTKLYNERPAWLIKAHKTLDDTVASSYGFAHDISDNDVLEALLALNKERVLLYSTH